MCFSVTMQVLVSPPPGACTKRVWAHVGAVLHTCMYTVIPTCIFSTHSSHFNGAKFLVKVFGRADPGKS
jgi:hypothetical protein